MNVTVQSNTVRLSKLYTESYFQLTGVADVVMPQSGPLNPSQLEKEVKPFMVQMREFLKRFTGNVAAAPTTLSAEVPEQMTLELPASTETFSDRFDTTLVPLQYTLLEHVIKDLHTQLAFLTSLGVSVWSIDASDIYGVEVSPEKWRYVLLTSNVSFNGGTSKALDNFLSLYVVGGGYVTTKVNAYKSRLGGVPPMSEWL